MADPITITPSWDFDKKLEYIEYLDENDNGHVDYNEWEGRKLIKINRAVITDGDEGNQAGYASFTYNNLNYLTSMTVKGKKTSFGFHTSWKNSILQVRPQGQPWEHYYFAFGALTGFEIGKKRYSVKTIKNGMHFGTVTHVFREYLNHKEFLQKYIYNKYGRIIQVRNKDDKVVKEDPVSRFLFMSEYYDRDLQFYILRGITWFSPHIGKSLSGGAPKWVTDTQLSSKEEMNKNAMDRVMEIDRNVYAWQHRNDGFFYRYGMFWAGVGKGFGKFIKETGLMVGDVIAYGVCGIAGEDHDPWSALFTAIEDPNITADDMLEGAVVHIVTLPLQALEALQYGNMEEFGERTFDIAFILQPKTIMQGTASGASKALAVTGKALSPLLKTKFAREMALSLALKNPLPRIPKFSKAGVEMRAAEYVPGPGTRIPIPLKPIPMGERIPLLPATSTLPSGARVGPGMLPRPGFKFTYEGGVAPMEGMVTLRVRDIIARALSHEKAVNLTIAKKASGFLRSKIIHKMANEAGLRRLPGFLYRFINKETGKITWRRMGSQLHETPLYGRFGQVDVQGLSYSQHGGRGVSVYRHHRPMPSILRHEGGTKQILVTILRMRGQWVRR
jgi:hypothetical protein